MSGKRKVETGQDGGGSAATQVKMGKNDLPVTSEQKDNCDDSVNDQDDNGRKVEDWAALLAIFPEELWILILESIKDPELLECVSNASPAFRDLLLPRRVHFLFPKVWNILGFKYHKEARDVDDDDDQVAGSGDDAYQEPRSDPDDSEDEDDDEQSTTWCSGILKLRSVCKTWCDAMDHWYQNQPFRYAMYNEEPFETDSYHRTVRKINSLAEVSFHEGALDSLESFRAHFESTHCVDGVAIRNPYLGRSVSLYIGWQSDGAEQFLERVKTLFFKYGRHIWYLKLNVDSTVVARVSGYSVISTLLQAVPNLRSLHLTNVSPDGSQDELLEEIDMDDDLYDYLESYIGLHPLPKLEHLQFLSTRHFAKLIPSVVFQQLVGLNDQLSILETGYCDYSLDDYNISTAELPNLRELALDIHLEVTFQHFFARDNIHWRLEKLDLTIFHAFSVEWERLFKELELKWADTLTTLILTLPLVQSVQDRNRLLELGGNLRLNLPRLTQLYLSMNSLCSLDFLLPMKESLQVLKLEMDALITGEAQCRLAKRVETGKVIQLLTRPDQPMESNVWTLFPKLKRLQLDYRMSSHSETRKHKDCSESTKWSVSREEWENWRKQNHCHRREKMGLWKIRRYCR